MIAAVGQATALTPDGQICAAVDNAIYILTTAADCPVPVELTYS